jgi:hypothetical protein
MSFGQAPAPVADLYFPDAVHWSIDEPNKTINLTVKLQFYDATGRLLPGDMQRVAARIKAAIEKEWNGHTFKCYQVKVTLDVSVVKDIHHVAPDAVDIAITSGPADMGANTAGVGPGHYLSTDPADRARPGRGDSNTYTHWQSNPLWVRVYSHEFGHVIGLDDNYDPATPNHDLRPGASKDLMYSEEYPISQDVINRAVLRSGLPISQLKCQMSMKAGPTALNLILGGFNDFVVQAHTCDYPAVTTDPKAQTTMQWTGNLSYTGNYLGFSGAANIPVSYQLNVPAAGGRMEIPMQSGSSTLIIAADVKWAEGGLLVAGGALEMGAGGQFVSTTQFFPGPALYASFSQGAPECPA